MLYLKFGQTWNAMDGDGVPVGTVGRQFNIFETSQACLNGHGIIGYIVRTQNRHGEICVYPRLYELLEENNTDWAANVVRNEDNPVHGPTPRPPGQATPWCNVVTHDANAANFDPSCVCGKPQCQCSPKVTYAYGRSGVEWLSQYFDLEFMADGNLTTIIRRKKL
jgi:hypothetical protein